MTSHKNLKRQIRTRMGETGERYSTARMHILAASRPPADIPNRVEGYELAGGGADPDVAALHNALLAAGVLNPADGEPFSDAMVFGLGGGIGFLYALFEYEGWDPMLSIGVRHTMLGHDFARAVLARTGVGHDVFTTGSAARAAGALDDALAAGRVPVVSLDWPSLPLAGVPDHFKTMSSHQAVVVGADADRVWLDAGRLVAVDRQDYTTARAAYRKAKHQMLTVTDPVVDDLAAGIREAIVATTHNFVESPYRGFASNWGFAGQEKWAALMVDHKNAKGWPRVFDTDPLAWLALWRVHESIESSYTPGSAGRTLYGEFLIEAAPILGVEALVGLGEEFVELGGLWSEVAGAALSGEPSFRDAIAIEAERDRALDEAGAAAGPRRRALFERVSEVRAGVVFPDGFVAGRFAELAELVGALAARERSAVERLARVI